jgi:hypothetical protein
MLKEEYNSHVASNDSETKVKKDSLLDKFIIWFRDFLDTAE